MKFTETQKNKETLGMLVDVLDYLQRLASVPATRSLSEQIKNDISKADSKILNINKLRIRVLMLTSFDICSF